MQRAENVTPDLARALELVEADVWAEWASIAPPVVQQRLGTGMVRIGAATAGLAPGTDVLMYNRVVGLGIDEPATDLDLDRLIGAYGDAGVARWMIQWSPLARPPAFAELLLACGFRHHNNWTKLYRRARAPLPHYSTHLRVENVGDGYRGALARVIASAFEFEDDLAAWSAALVGRSGWSTYMAFDGELPVATGMLYQHDGTAWLGFGATLPEYRGRGAQAAITAARVREAESAGCGLLVVETAQDLPDRPVASFRNMRRFGFDVAYVRPNYVMDAGDEAARDVA
jgi:ribosomal protein S18 acetylase RimI-like enzyme